MQTTMRFFWDHFLEFLFSFKKFNYWFSRHVFKILKLLYFLHTSGTKIQAKFCVLILLGNLIKSVLASRNTGIDKMSLSRYVHVTFKFLTIEIDVQMSPQ